MPDRAPIIYWFRDDLRLHDNPALTLACREGERLLPVAMLPDDRLDRWGLVRTDQRRRAFRLSALRALRERLRAAGSDLLVLPGPPESALPELARRLGATTVVCEDIATPWEQDEVAALSRAGLTVRTVWQSSLLDPETLPWPVARLPAVFTRFRVDVEKRGLRVAAPLPEPVLPPLPAHDIHPAPLDEPLPPADARSSFPFPDSDFLGGEDAALAHLARYLDRGLPHRYKQTRDQLQGVDFSTKFSPWLACGALSPRTLHAALLAFEAGTGRSESSYWIEFELLWRDYFRFLHLQHGRALYRARGLSTLPPPRHDAAMFARWLAGETGEPLIDAGLHELAATGFVSNRMRQILASHFIHTLGGDWRAGAAAFESLLIDHDCYSNQGNWLYIAGRGTDPRGGRVFNVALQAQRHDADGIYRRSWA